MSDSASTPDGDYRAGIVALLGPPNAGKSTLLNALLGEKLAIVTAKPQTTRSRILGIHSTDSAQIVFIDTPGMHAGSKVLNQVLNEAVESAARDCEVAVLLVDRTRGWKDVHDKLLAVVHEAGKPLILAGTKSDLVDTPAKSARASGEPWPRAALEAASRVLDISARTREGLNELEAALIACLPLSPPLYPADELTDRSLRWLAGELVREALFEELDKELPYAMAVEVTSWDESRPDLVKIGATLFVARESQKRIVIGRGGAKIKRIGSRARLQIEKLVGNRVHLELWVKPDPRWLKDKRRIEELGYR
jgi:GTP-binding protein Era